MKSPIKIRSLLEESILRTLLYADIFHFPLTKEEVWKYLISPISYSRQHVFTALKRIPESCHNGMQYGVSKTVAAKERNTILLEKKLRDARQAAKILGWIPTILCICVTGGTAVGNVKPDDDIDLMIITRSGWLWTTRLLAVVLSKLLGKYRSRLLSEHHSPAVRDRWCLNVWLDTSSLMIPVERQNIYTAHEVVQTFPILNREKTHEHFLMANAWTTAYLPHASEKQQYIPGSMGTMNSIEHIAFEVQKRYMQGHQTKEVATSHTAFFHPRGTAISIQRMLEKRLQKFFLVPYPSYNQEVSVSKIYMQPRMKMLIRRIWELKQHGKHIVYASGVFDLLHSEHKTYLERSRMAGDVLVVGIESDVRAQAMKGKGRPIQSERVRMRQVTSLSFVDETFILPKDFLTQARREELLFLLRPDVYTGSSHSLFQKEKSALMKVFGGMFRVVHEYNPHISTSHLISSQETR